MQLTTIVANRITPVNVYHTEYPTNAVTVGYMYKYGTCFALRRKMYVCTCWHASMEGIFLSETNAPLPYLVYDEDGYGMANRYGLVQ